MLVYSHSTFSLFFLKKWSLWERQHQQHQQRRRQEQEEENSQEATSRISIYKANNKKHPLKIVPQTWILLRLLMMSPSQVTVYAQRQKVKNFGYQKFPHVHQHQRNKGCFQISLFVDHFSQHQTWRNFCVLHFKIL